MVAEHEGDGQREQAEQLAAQPLHAEDHGADPRAERRRQDAGGEQRPQERARRSAVVSVAVVYMPAPKNAPWPKLK